MSREEIQKLLGGYATDTLSEAEQSALFEAALENQELFDALAKELALREVLADPQSRRQLLAALEPAREPSFSRAWRWLRQPAGLAAAATLATLLIVTGVVWRRNHPPERSEALVAQVKTPASPAPLPSAAPVKEFQPPPAKQKSERAAPLPKPPALPPQGQVVSKDFLGGTPAAPEPPHADTISADARLVREQPAAPRAAGAVRGSAGISRGAATSTFSHSPAPAAAHPAPKATLPVPPVETARQLYSQQNAQAFGLSGRLVREKTMKRAGATTVASNLGVRYGLLRKGGDGEYSPVALDTVLHSGDSVRLQLEPNDSGYLYLFQRDATGGWRLASTQRVDRAQRCLLPAGGALQYDQPGAKELLVVLSRQEQPSLAGLDTAELDALASNANANLLKAAVSSEETAYAVDTRTQASEQRVVFEITLVYR